MLLGRTALADDNCLTNASDPAVSFPDGSYDYVFVVHQVSNGYDLCTYSPTVLDMSAFTSANLADFNHDGWLDLVYGVKGSGGGAVQIFLNDATGSGIVVLAATLPTGATQAPALVGALDLNGDGRPDIVTDNGSDGTASVMLNDGTGAFPTVKQYAVGSAIGSMTAMDLDGDGRPDIVATDYVGDAVDVLINTGTGDFKTVVAIPIGSAPYKMDVMDINNDGHPDIVTLNGGGTVSVLLNKGDGTFATPVTYPVLHPSFVSLIDVNNDGIPDIVTDFTWGAWYALVNNGDGSFAAPAWVAMPGGSGGGVDISGGGTTGVGGSTTPISGTSYSSGTGKVTRPTTPTTPGTTGGGPVKSTPPAMGSSGGGDMEWLSLTLLGLSGFLRRKRA